MSLNKNYIKVFFIFVILLTGVFLRTKNGVELLDYAHDQDLQGWIIKDIVVNKHFRLIGQETSTQGIFIGPLFYYLLLPFYLISRMDPIGGFYFSIVFGVFSILSFYLVFKNVFNERVGLILAFIYSVSFFSVSNDRSVVPTSPMLVWSAWFFYSLILISKGDQKKGFFLAGLLTALIWHINMGLAILFPLVFLSFYLSKRKLNLRFAFVGIITFLIFSLPLIFFEVRHKFPQTKALINAFSTHQGSNLTKEEQFLKVIYITSQNLNSIFFTPPQKNYYLLLVFFVFLLIFLKYKKILSKAEFLIMVFWQILFISFFSMYSKSVSEYYLNPMNLVWMVAAALAFNEIFKKAYLKTIGVFLIFLFILINIGRLLSHHTAQNGYLERKAIVSEIKKDAKLRGFPCISISYITKPGYNLGYRYLFWLENLHVNNPDSGSPVYTIVYPLNEKIFPVDKTFGALGLIYPDYAKYTKDAVEKSCSGENSNLTDPMFGFTG